VKHAVYATIGLQQSDCELTETSRDREGRGHEGWDLKRGRPLPTGTGSLLQRIFFEISSKMQGFMHFYSAKLLLARNWDQGA